MKATHRIPTEQYAYIEFELEHNSPEQALEEHKRLACLYSNFGKGLTPQQFAQARRDMLTNGKVSVDQWDECDVEQRKILHQFDLTLRDIVKA